MEIFTGINRKAPPKFGQNAPNSVYYSFYLSSFMLWVKIQMLHFFPQSTLPIAYAMYFLDYLPSDVFTASPLLLKFPSIPFHPQLVYSSCNAHSINLSF